MPYSLKTYMIAGSSMSDGRLPTRRWLLGTVIGAMAGTGSAATATAVCSVLRRRDLGGSQVSRVLSAGFGIGTVCGAEGVWAGRGDTGCVGCAAVVRTVGAHTADEQGEAGAF